MLKVPDSKPSSKWYEKHCFDLHRKKVESIKNAPRIRLPSDSFRPSKSQKSLSPSHKHLEVLRENKALLERIAYISTTKVLGSVWTKPSWETTLPTSLNGTFRRLELQRIASENRFMSSRLVEGKASIRAKQLEDDFKKTRKYQQLYKSAFVDRKPSKHHHLASSDPLKPSP